MPLLKRPQTLIAKVTAQIWSSGDRVSMMTAVCMQTMQKTLQIAALSILG